MPVIFINLSRGEYLPFGEIYDDVLDLVGNLVARRAIRERRHIVTEMIGTSAEAVSKVVDAMVAQGYQAQIQYVTLDVVAAWQQNLSRGDDNISAYYAEPYHVRWLLAAAAAEASKG